MASTGLDFAQIWSTPGSDTVSTLERLLSSVASRCECTRRRWLLRASPASRASASEALADEWFSSFMRLLAQGARALSSGAVCEALVFYATSSRLRQVGLHALAQEVTEPQVAALRQALGALGGGVAPGVLCVVVSVGRQMITRRIPFGSGGGMIRACSD